VHVADQVAGERLKVGKIAHVAFHLCRRERSGLSAGDALEAMAADRNNSRRPFNPLKCGQGGFVIGGSAANGAVNFHGRLYPLVIGGVSYGFTFGGSLTDFVGTLSNIRTPYDVNGIYVAGGAGAAVGVGGGAIVLVNQSGAVLTLSGFQSGLIVAAELNGLVISVR
jgi:hypothetical protein